MHPAALYRWDDRTAALAFVAQMSFAHVFVQTPDGPRVAHVPLLVDGDRLRFHLSNSNGLTRFLDGAVALASIAGPQSYVSPRWYVRTDGVPTWDYVAVECEGPVRHLDASELIDLLDASAAEHEARIGAGWTRAKMVPGRFEAMCKAITGFELTVTALRTTRKLSQDSDTADIAGVVAGLAAALDDVIG